MDYRSYELSIRQKGEIILCACGAALVVSWLFYDNLYMCLLAPLLYILLRRLRREREKRLRQELLLQQFLDLLRALSGALQAGYSIENALREAQAEVTLLHGRDSYIGVELRAWLQGMAMNISLETLFYGLADRTDREEIREFAEVFGIARKSSGTIGEIIESTEERISGRYETKKEIEVATASRKMEQNVMNVIPIFILLYLKLTDPDYMKALYDNPAGVIFMTICLGAYLAALYLAQRMSDIRI